MAATSLKTLVLSLIFLVACGGREGTGTNNWGQPDLYSYEVINTWPHDPKAYTQGLVFYQGYLWEGTGQHGSSSLRKVELATGKVVIKVDLPAQYFGEGITIFRNRIYQLTWQSRKGFVYDPATLNLLAEFSYDGDGWGLTNTEEHLIMSDGSDRLRFLDPSTFKVSRVLSVRDDRGPVTQLNELEYTKGEIFANIWHSDRIARIDPISGRVRAWIDLAGLRPANKLHDTEAVLNGIAYDGPNDRLFVTGKLWPMIYEIRLVKR